MKTNTLKLCIAVSALALTQNLFATNLSPIRINNQSKLSSKARSNAGKPATAEISWSLKPNITIDKTSFTGSKTMNLTDDKVQTFLNDNLQIRIVVKKVAAGGSDASATFDYSKLQACTNNSCTLTTPGGKINLIDSDKTPIDAN